MRYLRVLREPQIIDFQFVKAQEDVLVELCKKDGIVLFFIYGSLAQNQMKKLSDVDVAVLKSSGKISLDNYLQILGEIQKIFKREDIDLVDLNEAPSLLRMRILQFGRLIYYSDPKVLAQFRYKTITAYLSASYLRKSFSGYLRRAYGVL